ncbi:MAG: dimethylargininase [Galactobacter sp.]
MSKIALVRRPGTNLNEGLVDNIERVDVDVPLAHQQWEGYVAELASAGWDVREVVPAPECPDAVFVEDSVLMYKNVAVSMRSGAPSRQPEPAGTRKLVAELGCSLNQITAPGTMDGGDILKIGDTVYVGQGGRTNAEGIRQLRAILSPLGATVVAVPVTKVLHLKTAVTALPDGTVIGFPDFVDNPSIFPRFIPIPEEHGTAVVCLSDSHVIMSASAPKTAELLRGLGYQVTTVDLTEFEKLEGCVTCLSVRVRGLAD